MHIILIAAVMRNGVIGNGNQLVWRHPDDMKRFRDLTTDKTVLMGRKTWESLPEKYRPLPKRTNVVITRNDGYALPNGVLRFPSIEAALRGIADLGPPGAAQDIWVIGGGETYAQAMPLADRLEITHVDQDIPGDVRFPDIDPAIWEQVVGDSRPAQGFRFASYERKV